MRNREENRKNGIERDDLCRGHSRGPAEEMRKDNEIILLGEDIKINVWTVTRDLYKEFGDRVINTPLSESGFAGRRWGRP